MTGFLLGERESAVQGREHAARHNGNELAYIDAALFDPGGFHGVRRRDGRAVHGAVAEMTEERCDINLVVARPAGRVGGCQSGCPPTFAPAGGPDLWLAGGPAV